MNKYIITNATYMMVNHYKVIDSSQYNVIKIFGGEKLTAEGHIDKFSHGNDPIKHINNWEKEWKRIGYQDERIWPHLFRSTLYDLPNKWYKIKESLSEIFTQ